MNSAMSTSMGLSLLVCGLFLASGIGAWSLKPRETMQQNVSLEQAVPRAFGDWKALASGLEQTSLAVAGNGDPNEEQPYSQVLMRTYENGRGERVMLALGYAKFQRQEVRIHRPEVCYTAQGFELLDDRIVRLPQPRSRHEVAARRLLMRNGSRIEAVTYWTRIGAHYPVDAVDTRLTILRDGLQGRVPDAILVRASTLLRDENEMVHGVERQERFLTDLVHSMPPGTETMLVATVHQTP